jgi:5-methyltetrahydrofolate--homocysteine methyltransferase
MEKELSTIFEAILEGNLSVVQEHTQAAIEAEIPAEKILKQGLIPAMEEVGRLFEDGEFFVPEMLIAARAMQAGLNLLKPLLVDSGIEPVGKVAIGTVKGDLHDIGKNLVAMMLEGAGFEITDLGTDVAPEAFVETVIKGANIIGLSALLTTTMPSMESTMRALEEAGVRDQIKIIVGGAPVTQEYADLIGADGFAADASQAVALAKTLIGL